MQKANEKTAVKKDLRRLFASMDYVADNYLCKKRVPQKTAGAMYAVYQLLGELWVYIGARCKHWDGYRKKEKSLTCKICGKVKNTPYV